MTRRTFRILLCLLLGVVTTLFAAWVLPSYLTTPSAFQRTSSNAATLDETTQVVSYVYSWDSTFSGGVTLVYYPYATLPDALRAGLKTVSPDMAAVTPYWADYILGKPAPPVGAEGFSQRDVTSVGWPFRSMMYEWWYGATRGERWLVVVPSLGGKRPDTNRSKGLSMALHPIWFGFALDTLF